MTTLLVHKQKKVIAIFFTILGRNAFMISIDKERVCSDAADYERPPEVALELFEYRGRKPVNLLPDGMF